MSGAKGASLLFASGRWLWRRRARSGLRASGRGRTASMRRSPPSWAFSVDFLDDGFRARSSCKACVASNGWAGAGALPTARLRRMARPAAAAPAGWLLGGCGTTPGGLRGGLGRSCATFVIWMCCAKFLRSVSGDEVSSGGSGRGVSEALRARPRSGLRPKAVAFSSRFSRTRCHPCSLGLVLGSTASSSSWMAEARRWKGGGSCDGPL
mmetsp:Transcript_80444/g.192906  ORF Transcript_80444/g.192906 Transcript_80444/m.192906 type:complete len:209 (+) Transcript_80444:1049-1675(+)